MFAEAEFWVAVSFVLFIGLLVYMKVFPMLGKALDDRAGNIRKELDEARELKEEAQSLLASYQRKKLEAEKEADDIIAQAKDEAVILKQRAADDLKEQIARRMKAVEDKISQAEADAIRDVRQSAADLAVAATRKVMTASLDESKHASLVDEAISSLKSKLH